MHGGESLTRKVGNAIMKLVVMRHNEASLLAAEVVADIKCHTKYITMVWKFRWIDAVSQEEGIPPILRP